MKVQTLNSLKEIIKEDYIEQEENEIVVMKNLSNPSYYKDAYLRNDDILTLNFITNIGPIEEHINAHNDIIEKIKKSKELNATTLSNLIGPSSSITLQFEWRKNG